jgi:hypothetical protein
VRPGAVPGTLLVVQQPQPLEVANRLLSERFLNPHAAYLGGSVLTDRRTPTSDLDIVVVLEGPPAPYRETLRYDGWVVELFVHTPTSLRHYWDKDAQGRRPPLLRMCAEGHVLVSRDGAGEHYAAEAAARLAAGPAAPEAELLDLQRYLLTDLLDDFRGCSDPVELAYLSSSLLLATSELLLLVANTWSGSGKWLPRCVTEVDADLPSRLVVAQRSALDGYRAELEQVVLEVLAHAGGPLTEGYRAAGEDPAH